jgi:hypothetical protein
VGTCFGFTFAASNLVFLTVIRSFLALSCALAAFLTFCVCIALLFAGYAFTASFALPFFLFGLGFIVVEISLHFCCGLFARTFDRQTECSGGIPTTPTITTIPKIPISVNISSQLITV